MKFFGDAFHQAWLLIWHHDPFLWDLIRVTLKVATIPTALALVVGLPLGVGIGLARWRGSGVLRVLANVGLGLPPVVVGLTFALLMLPDSPLGRFHLLFTFRGVIVAQTALALPIIVALTSSAVRDISPGLLDQARAFGAGQRHVTILAAREARIGIFAATIAAMGSGLSEIGAVALVGGNIVGSDQTLASASLTTFESGDFAAAMAIGIVLLALILLVTAILTWLQYGGRTSRAWARS